MVEHKEKQTGLGTDDRPRDREVDDELKDLEDRDFGWEEGDPADRRRDPLRKPM